MLFKIQIAQRPTLGNINLITPTFKRWFLVRRSFCTTSDVHEWKRCCSNTFTTTLRPTNHIVRFTYPLPVYIPLNTAWDLLLHRHELFQNGDDFR